MMPDELEKKINWFKKDPLKGIFFIALSILVLFLGVCFTSFVSEEIKFRTKWGKFNAHFSNLVIEEQGPNSAALVLALAVSNSGSKAIIPSKFTLFVKKKRKWIPLKETLIKEYPENFKVENPLDLQTYAGTLVTDVPVIGFLKFIAQNISKVDLKSLIESQARIKLICEDKLNRKRYEVFLHYDEKFKKMTEYMEYSKHKLGVLV